MRTEDVVAVLGALLDEMRAGKAVPVFMERRAYTEDVTMAADTWTRSAINEYGLTVRWRKATDA